MKQLSVFFLVFLVATHIISCLWYQLTFIYPLDNWLMSYQAKFSDFDQSNLNLYLTSLYWSVTTFCTVGFGDIVPINHLEMGFTVLWIIFGISFYSYVIGVLISIIEKHNKKRLSISKRFHFLKEMNKFQPMDKSLLEEMTIQLEQQEQGSQGKDLYQQQNVLESLP